MKTTTQRAKTEKALKNGVQQYAEHQKAFGRGFLTVVYAVLLLALTPKSLLATNVSGTVFGTWTSNNSPYHVVGNIQVSVLTIKPGVTVLFDGDYVFQVAGTLQAIGTPDSPIIFTATNGGWQGIYFNISGPGSVLAKLCYIQIHKQRHPHPQ